MEKLYELCYTKREVMIHCSKSTLINKLLFKIVDYFARKY